jgi:hypothetical protein
MALPTTAIAHDVHRFQVHVTDRGARPPKLISATSALHFSLAQGGSPGSGFPVGIDMPLVNQRLTAVVGNTADDCRGAAATENAFALHACQQARVP